MNAGLDLGHIIFALIGAFIAIIGWFITRTLKQIDTNQTILFARLHDVELDLIKLNAHTEYCRVIHAKKDKPNA